MIVLSPMLLLKEEKFFISYHWNVNLNFLVEIKTISTILLLDALLGTNPYYDILTNNTNKVKNPNNLNCLHFRNIPEIIDSKGGCVDRTVIIFFTHQQSISLQVYIQINMVLFTSKQIISN